MKKRPWILLSLLSLLAALPLPGCVDKVEEPLAYPDYANSVYAPMTQKEKEEITAAYFERFGTEIRWCSPIEKDGFDTYDQLRDYVDSHNGLRCYAIYGDSFVLSSFLGGLGGRVAISRWNTLFYDDPVENPLIDYRPCWSISHWGGTVYRNGEFLEIPRPLDSDKFGFCLSDVVPITLEEALLIKQRHQNYLDRFFGKFMEEGETDPNQAFQRLLNGFGILE